MLKTSRVSLLSSVLICGLALSESASAVEVSTATSMNAIGVCQSLVPAASGMRSRLAGFNNESTTASIYVTCGLLMAAGSQPIAGYGLIFHSIDQVSRSISCTGTAGLTGVFDPLKYSTKSVSSTSAGGYAGLDWAPSDFGGNSDPYMAYTYAPSITCLLPPQTAIIMAQTRYSMEIGN